jgi:hypothetical protein
MVADLMQLAGQFGPAALPVCIAAALAVLRLSV